MEKLKIEQLSVQSFVTKLNDENKKTLEGGWWTIIYNSNARSCHATCVPASTNPNNPDCPGYKTSYWTKPEDVPVDIVYG